MLRRRAPQVLIGTALVGLGATALAVPAQADTTFTVTGTFDASDLADVTSTDGEFGPSRLQGATVTLATNITWTGAAPTLAVKNDFLSHEGADCSNGCVIASQGSVTFDVDSRASFSTVAVQVDDNGTLRNISVNGSDVVFLLTYEAPPTPDPSTSDSTGSASASSPTVQLQALDLFGDGALPAGESGLVGWEKAVPVNTWQALPQSEDVVGIGANEGKVFLGMATTPDFPVDIAQRQVDNGWGAYQMHGVDGEVESVFIPAGGSMFVWTQPRLYAVWGTA